MELVCIGVFVGELTVQYGCYHFPGTEGHPRIWGIAVQLETTLGQKSLGGVVIVTLGDGIFDFQNQFQENLDDTFHIVIFQIFGNIDGLGIGGIDAEVQDVQGHQEPKQSEVSMFSYSSHGHIRDKSKENFVDVPRGPGFGILNVPGFPNNGFDLGMPYGCSPTFWTSPTFEKGCKASKARSTLSIWSNTNNNLSPERVCFSLSLACPGWFWT